jgi:signal transduction histidine kinase
MLKDDIFFIQLCFYTIGFLSLAGVITAFLNTYFSSKIYKFYSIYLLVIIAFVGLVYVKNTGYYPKKSDLRINLNLIADLLQILSHFFFCGFVYHAMIMEDFRFKKLKKVYLTFFFFTIGYVLILILFPRFVSRDFVFFLVTRIVIFVLSVIFYYQLFKNLDRTFFRFLFAAVSFVFFSGFLALWDSVSSNGFSKYTGFDYLCYGYFLENLCFVGAMIYKYFSTEKEKEIIALTHKQELVSTQKEIQQETIEHIGREIHDNIGQKLTLASLYTQQLEFENKAPQINTTIEHISNIINESIAELRELSKSLIDNAIDTNTLSQLIEKESEKIKLLNKCDIIFKSDVFSVDLKYQEKSILIRIVQEFINNSIKHSQCHNIFISLMQEHNTIVLSLKDDGIGFSPKSISGGQGIANMKKRAAIIQAKMEFISAENNGTQLLIRLPYGN